MKRKIIIVLSLMTMLVLLTGCQCKHQWQAATCISPQTCSQCGEVQGEPLGHKWTEATCVDAKFCTICGATHGNPLGHNWSDATCTQSQTCSRCGETEGDPLGHTWEEATCEHPKQCTVCGETDGESLPHTVEQWNTIKEASCAEVGQSEGICSICGLYITEELPTVDHTPGEWEIVADATENAPGTKQQKCTECGAVLAEEEFTLTPEEIKAAYIADCDTFSYREISRNPGQYKGEKAKFQGRVIQVMQEEYLGFLIYVLRVNVDGGYSNTIYVTYYASKDDPRILEDDWVTMYGELAGEKTYETVMGASVTIPQFDAEYIDVR